MLQEDFDTTWLLRSWAIGFHVIIGVIFSVIIVCCSILQVNLWVFILEGAIFWINLYLAALNWNWFKKRWVVYTIDDITYVDEGTQELYNFIESEEYSLCQVPSREQDESDVMTS